MKDTCKILRNLLNDQECYIMPGVFECIGAKIAQNIGFKLISVTGNGLSGSLIGMPDMGIISFKEVADAVGNISDSVKIPVIADGDTGFGNVINTMRTVENLEKCGAAGVHLEDQIMPKKCAYYDKIDELLNSNEHAQKIKAATLARKNKDFVIIARTDALKVYGMEETLERVKKYEKAGADAIFVVGIKKIEQIKKIHETILIPIIINVNDGSSMSRYSIDEMKNAGVKIIMYPATVRSAMVRATEDALSNLFKNGNSNDISEMASLNEFNNIIGLEKYLDLEKQFLI